MPSFLNSMSAVWTTSNVLSSINSIYAYSVMLLADFCKYSSHFDQTSTSRRRTRWHTIDVEIVIRQIMAVAEMGKGFPWLAYRAENHNFYYFILIILGRVSCSNYFMAIHNLRCSVQRIKMAKRDQKIFEITHSRWRRHFALPGYRERLEIPSVWVGLRLFFSKLCILTYGTLILNWYSKMLSSSHVAESYVFQSGSTMMCETGRNGFWENWW